MEFVENIANKQIKNLAIKRENKEAIKKLDEKFIMNTYGRHDVLISSAKGVIATDHDGKVYIDVSSGIGVNSLGYCDDGWVQAVTDQLCNVQHISNYYYCENSAYLAAKLCNLSGLSKVFFGNSGAEANECAIKIARKYSFDKYGADRNEIITLNNSFHGRTITTLSATGQEVFHNYFFPFTEGFKYSEPNNFEMLKNTVDDKTCAVMLECIQGEGGVNILDKEYIESVAQLCKEKDILLIIDEVQTGIGRTGKMFCYEYFDIKPDIVTLAKGLGGGLPIGVCLCSQKLENVLTISTHGTTFGGNPVVCAGANYILDVVSKPEFLSEVNKKGDYIANKIQQIKGVKSVRHMGLMIGIELENDNAKELVTKCINNGLLIITAKNLLRMLPPLIISYEEIDAAVRILEATILEDLNQ